MATSSQVLLLADHIKLSLLERQRAISLNLEPNSHDGEISRSLDSLLAGLEELEAQPRPTQETLNILARARPQYADLYSQFHGKAPPKPTTTTPNDPSLATTFASARTRVANKAVRFRDDPSADDNDAEHQANRAALLPYTDTEPEDSTLDHAQMDNQQIHEYHAQVMRHQDEQLDRLGESVGRTRHLSIQIGDELDEQGALLEDVDEHVDRHTASLERAKARLGTIARKAKDNMQLTVIFILIIVLVLLIIILE